MSTADLTILVIIALLVFGPKRRPQLMRELRQAILEIHRITKGRGGPGGPAAA